MTAIDPTKTWRLAEERLVAETDPILRRNLALLIQHMKAEAYLDMDALMATVSEDAHYHFWSPAGVDEKVGKAAVQEFYEGVGASGMHRIHHDITNLVVDKHCIITEGEISIAYPGQLLNMTRGMALNAETFYLYQTQMLIVWPIDEHGLFVGEDSYSGVDGFVGIENRPLDLADIMHIEKVEPTPVYPAA